MRLLIVAIFFIHTASPAFADENYVCFLDKFMEVANDGRFFGPEATEIKMQISIEKKQVFLDMDDSPRYALGLIEKLGTAQFAAKGGDVASMTTLHVWKRQTSEKYDVQYSTNYARSITIRTGVCYRD
jgi:hypothetical protein